ncbi:hypothetical protein N657DRAFT_680329 [Parathielavia appendiculata]|uniref:Uncharacterized protein n=1 Tax=Parathielavia appendiculata TaxID=2587402 RepID=A0AAN6U192_9PEZI|nr:hypothetical protein N657DRAFT_680329 [Parathielavia appendiculata]
MLPDETVKDAEPELLAVLETDTTAVDESPADTAELGVADEVNDLEKLGPAERVEEVEPKMRLELNVDVVAVKEPPELVADEPSPLELLDTDRAVVVELSVVNDPELSPVEVVADSAVEIWLMGVTIGLPVLIPARGRVMVLWSDVAELCELADDEDAEPTLSEVSVVNVLLDESVSEALPAPVDARLSALEDGIAAMVDVEKVDLSELELGVNEEEGSCLVVEPAVCDAWAVVAAEAAPVEMAVVVGNSDASLDDTTSAASPLLFDEALSLDAKKVVESLTVPACLGNFAGCVQRRGRMPTGPASAAATSERTHINSVDVRISPVPSGVVLLVM